MEAELLGRQTVLKAETVLGEGERSNFYCFDRQRRPQQALKTEGSFMVLKEKN